MNTSLRDRGDNTRWWWW